MPGTHSADVRSKNGNGVPTPRTTFSEKLVLSIPICAVLVFLVGAVVTGRVFYVVSRFESPQFLSTEGATEAQVKEATEAKDERLLRATFNLAEKQLAVRAVQLAAGYGVGFLCVSSGLILAWCGVSGQVEFKIGAERSSVSLKTGSIGAAIVFFGVLLIAISMWSRPIRVESNGGLKFESGFGDTPSHVPATVEF
jgi:hypothetical protein